jgi:hypothetical protein
MISVADGGSATAGAVKPGSAETINVIAPINPVFALAMDRLKHGNSNNPHEKCLHSLQDAAASSGCRKLKVPFQREDAVKWIGKI